MREQHGMTDSPEYKSWAMMLSRCRDARNPGYKHYGGRGISFDPRWESFESFFGDMGHRPDGTTLERKDVNGDYTKDNCRWADHSDQRQNTRKLHGNNTYTGAQFALGKWRSYITKDKRQYGLGQYKEELDAVTAYDIAATTIYPHGKRNFPERQHLYDAITTLLGITADDFDDEPYKIIPAAVMALNNIESAGDRGAKSKAQDIQEAVDTLHRYQAMRKEDGIV